MNGYEQTLAELKNTQARLLQAQKLESIGQLAAGIAHEINTPTQYITDNVEFLARAFERFGDVIAACRVVIEQSRAGATPSSDAVARADQVLAKSRLDFLLSEGPKAVAQALDGLHRVGRIVSAMKEFSHPSAGEKSPVDLGEAIQTTITVATNEWKYIADVETEFDPNLPMVRCLRDEMSQVFLNLIVNASHAIDSASVGGTNGKGRIRIETQLCDDDDGDEVAEIRISDTGCGIPEEARARVFDPFFTTKPVGKGTGQGLAIAYSVVVDKHGGEIQFETELGRGTTFIIRLPVNPHEERPSSTVFVPPQRTDLT